ncbi:MAG: tRNA (adenosine(37)-N6)-threonylcarbamoyltransferase complex dimerization subunit type 1 TsaB [Planctomycetes bacterium]|nr:tRNA (adenosine(37)-N6)-threonylcarbamoyltransferase complex dimerization subunit type 1 TsaB [Planctomycetota bacterium]
MKILSIESVTEKGEIALIDVEQNTTKCVQLEEGHNHGKEIALAVKKLLEQQCTTFNEINAICIDIGPGSYTGIRVGIAYAKGFVLPKEIPVYSCCSLKAMAYNFFKFKSSETYNSVTVIMDAKWDEIYMAKYTRNLEEITEPTMVQKSKFTSSEDEKVAYLPRDIMNIAGRNSIVVYPTAEAIGNIAIKDKLPPIPLYIRDTAPQIRNPKQK